MQLSIDLLKQVTGLLGVDRSDNRDKRRQPRVGLRARTRIVPLVVDDTGGAMDVWVKDLSAGGIGLTGPRAVPQGAVFNISLPARGGKFITVQYRVAHSNRVGPGVFAIGAVFEKIVNEAKGSDNPLAGLGHKEEATATRKAG
jgi:hypothetical protein